ncbi:MAG: ArsR/SmtB family transcription factor [Candidatus Odinarchaeota archaeon]
MKIPYDDPETAIKIIEALADQTRRRILLYIQENPDGVTASNIAKTVNKKIPTILHHLQIFDELNLIYSEMKSIGSDTGREVRHWFVKEERLTIEIDFSYIAFIPDRDISEIFDSLKSESKIISRQLLSSDLPDSDILALNPRLNERQIDIIKKALSKQLEHYLYKWIDREYNDSGYGLALNILEFQKHYSLDGELAEKMFNELAMSKNYYLSRLRTCENSECNFVFQQQHYRFCPNCGTPVEEESEIVTNRLMKRKE